jgi:hypothetical protein
MWNRINSGVLLTAKEKQLLLSQANKLFVLGVVVEQERGKLKSLVERGVPYGDSEMLEALECFNNAEAVWKLLEAEHLELKERLGATVPAGDSG